jgi:hypothetical protein
MKFNQTRRLPAVLLILVLASLGQAAGGQTLAVGDLVPVISAKDQFGTNFTLTTNLECLLVVKEMACAKSANHKLADQGAGFLEKHGAAYLMDIHTMPGIARFFAFPKLRKYPERIVLVDAAAALARFPVQDGEVTVLTLTPERRIKRISYWNPDGDPVEKLFE